MRKDICLPHDALREPGGALYVGAAVPAELIVASTPNVAVVIRHIACYPGGFSFVLVVRCRQPQPSLQDAAETLFFIEGDPKKPRPSNIYLRVEFGDGRTLGVVSSRQDAAVPVLRALGGGGTSQCFQAEFAVPVLPPEDGEVSFVVDWGAAGIRNARAALPAGLLTKHSAAATSLWPVADKPR